MSGGQALDELFEAAPAVFARAVEAGAEPIERHYEIGGHRLRVCFAGPRLAGTLGPALEHLTAGSGGRSELTALVWDSRAGGVGLPPPPWTALRYFERGNVRGYLDDRFSLALDRSTGVFTAVDNSRQMALYWTRDGDHLPYYERAAPMRHLLQGWLQARGLFVAHAAAVCHEGAGVVLAGRGGAGKSTTALVCLTSGLGFLGDDFVLLSAHPARVASLYGNAKMNAAALSLVPELRASVQNSQRLDVEKAVIALAPAFSARLVRQAPVRVIMFPCTTGRSFTTASLLSPGDVFRTIAPDTVLRALGNAALGLRGLRELVRQVPGYRLELGTELSQIADVISRVAARHS
jgi:hypothetical protein